MLSVMAAFLISLAQILGVGFVLYSFEYISSRKNISTFIKEEYPYFQLQFLFLLLNLIIVPHAIKYVVGIFFQVTGKTYLLDLNPLMPQWALAISVFIFADFWGYIWHRALHSKYLWKLHYPHHSLHHVNWLTAFRFHPLELVLTSSTLYMFISLLNVSPYILQGFVLANSLVSMLGHMNCRWKYGFLGRIIVSPYYHSIHHSENTERSNFGGILTIWDKIFGTEVKKDDLKFIPIQNRDTHFLRNLLFISRGPHAK